MSNNVPVTEMRIVNFWRWHVNDKNERTQIYMPEFQVRLQNDDKWTPVTILEREWSENPVERNS
jgi:hypothetical protein